MLVVPLPAAAEPPELPRTRREWKRSVTVGEIPGSRAAPEVSHSKPSRSQHPDSFASEEVALPPYARLSKAVEHDLARLYAATRSARRIAVVCGAGVSVSAPANIPDFRSSAGLFRRLKERYPNAGLSSGKDLFDARLFSVCVPRCP